jgi:RNA polymerase sigma factor (sigma-70 family)
LPESHRYSEKELLLRISEGDEFAFKLLHRSYYDELKPLVWRYADTGIDPKEILQETFLKVWLSREKLPEIDNFRAWIFKIASREYLLALRRQLNYSRRLDAWSAIGADDAPVTPLQATHLEEINKFIGKVISQLSPQRRAIYEMSRRQGLKIDEIAEQLSLSRQTVKNVLQTVLKIIREQLTSAGYGPYITIFIFLKIF